MEPIDQKLMNAASINILSQLLSAADGSSAETRNQYHVSFQSRKRVRFIPSPKLLSQGLNIYARWQPQTSDLCLVFQKFCFWTKNSIVFRPNLLISIIENFQNKLLCKLRTYGRLFL